MFVHRFRLFCVSAVFAFIVLAGRGSAQTFSTSTGFNLNDGAVHTSTISVSATGTVASVSITLNSVTSNGSSGESMQNAFFLLTAPTGQQLVVLGATGNGTDGTGAGLTGLNITIADTASNDAPFNNTGWQASGSVSVKPSSYGCTYIGVCPPFGSTAANWAQTDGTGTLTKNFATGPDNEASANGTWTLSGEDVEGANNGDEVAITGWSITLTENSSGPTTSTTTQVTSGTNPSTSGGAVTFTAKVSTSGGGEPTGTVAFTATAYPNSTADASTVTLCSASTLTSGGSGSNFSTTTCGPTSGLTIQGIYAINATYTPTSGSVFIGGSTESSFGQLVEPGTITPSGNQWCNSASLKLSTASQDSVLPMAYPSIIPVTGLSQSVANVTVELEGLSGIVDSGQFLLVSPSGGTYNLDFLSEGFNGGSASSITLTFSDTGGGSATESTAPATGSYTATDNGTFAASETAPFSTSPAPSIDGGIPQVPSTVNLATPVGGVNALNFEGAFSGSAASGKWALYAINNGGSTGSDLTLASGWCIDFTLNTGVATTTAVTSSKNPATTGTSVTFTATVTTTSGGNPVTSGTVTFEDNGATPAGTVSGNNVVTLNGSGQATFTTSSLAEGDHKITANYGGTGADNASVGFVWQREDNASTNTSLNTNPVTFCNTGAVQIATGGIGAFTPDPSNIFVTGLPGVISSVQLTLESFSTSTDPQINDIASLLVGPNGSSSPTTSQTLDFFSETGNSSTELSSGNYTFADSASSDVPQSPYSSGSYKPTSYAGGTPDTFFASPSGFYTLPSSYQYAGPTGSSTLASVYQGANGNGTWSLYFNQTTHADQAGASGGWCLQLTETAPDISVISSASPTTFHQGDTGDSINITVTNMGPGPTGGTETLTESIPTGLTVTAMSGSGWTCPAAQFPASSGTVSCTSTAAITASDNYPTVTATVSVASNAPSSVSNTVGTSGSMSPTDSYSETISVLAPAVLTISKSAVGTFTQGSTADWDVTVGNSAAAADVTTGTVTMSDTLPSGYTVSGFGTTNTTIWSCGGTGTQTATCTTTNQLAGGSNYSVIHIGVNVPAASPTSVTNTADAFGGGDVVHTNITNAVSASSTATVVQVPASVTITAGGTQSTPVSTAFGTALTVLVKDANSVAIPNQSVTFTAPSSGASGTFSNSSNTITGSTSSTGTVGQLSEAFTANGTAGGPYSVTATAGTVSASPAFSLTNTDTAATVTNVSSTTANGSYTTGAGINVTVTFSKAVTVTGTPQIALNSGGTASYASGSGTSSLSFTYTVATGQNSTLLDAVSSSSLTLNGGTIQDSSGTAANLSLPAPGATGSLSANKSIVINTATNVTSSVSISSTGLTYNKVQKQGTETFTIKNTSGATISGPVELVLSKLPSGVTAVNNAGTFQGNPYWTVTAGSLAPGASAQVTVTLAYASGTNVTATNSVYSGSI